MIERQEARHSTVLPVGYARVCALGQNIAMQRDAPAAKDRCSSDNVHSAFRSMVRKTHFRVVTPYYQWSASHGQIG